MENIQEQFNANKTGDFLLAPGEYQGPLLIDRPGVFDGGNATLWSADGPVLTIAADNVTIKNLRIELAGGDNVAGTALQFQAGNPDSINLENVEVKGAVCGFAPEAENWTLPGLIALGNFAADTENTFTLQLEAAAAAQLECNVRGVRLAPLSLTPGVNTITLTVSEMRHNTILYGEIMVKTRVSRRIYITGKALTEAQVHNEGQVVPNGPAVSLPVQMTAPLEMLAPDIDDSNVQHIKRGQRLSVKEWQNSVLKIALEYQTEDAQLDIDGYCFMLQGGRVRRDEDLIFFGNTESQGGAVKMSQVNDRPLTLVELAKAPADVERIAVCYSIYGDNQTQRFSAVKGAVVRIFSADKEIYRFALDELYEEKTAVAVELYRYKGEWKMNFVGAGYHSGLRHLCESYGVNIE